VDLRWLWSVLVKGRKLILLSVSVILLPTILYLWIAKPTFRSTATIQVNPESAKVLPYRDVAEPSGAVSNFDLYMKTQDELLRSKLLQLRVTDELRREHAKSGRTPSQGLAELPEIIRIEGSQIMKLSCTAAEPASAAAAANTWAEEFVKLHQELRSQTGKKAADFLQDQLRVLKSRLEEAEKKVVEYANSHQILNLDPRQENVVRQKFGFLSAEVARAEKDYFVSKAELDGLRIATPENFPDSLKDPVINSLETRAFALEQDLTQLQAQFDEKWPAVTQKREELAVVRAQLGRAKANTLRRIQKQAELKQTAARDQFHMLQNSFAEQTSLVDRLNRASVEYNSLKRDMETSEQLYQGLLQRLKETGVSAGLEIGNIQIADRAHPDSEPFRPRRALSLLLSLCIGLTLGIGLTVGREYLQSTLRDPMELEQLGLPVLGWVPKADAVPPQIGENGNGSHSGLLKSSLADTAIGQRELTVSQLRKRESYRALCVSLLLSQPNQPPRSVLVTSSIAREGKTTTTFALGHELAGLGLKTLLVDADFRSQALSRLVGVEGGEGLSTYLAGGRLCINDGIAENLSFLPTGAMPPNPISLFSSERFDALLQLLLGKYAIVLLDGPPVLSVADAQVLASKASGVVFVVNYEETPKDVIAGGLRLLIRSGAKILGGVVNQVDVESSPYSKYGKYYYDEKYLASQGKS
jgi:capsular exopolysaccharide synthesis family protein